MGNTIDAVLNWDNATAYFFNGNQYIKYNMDPNNEGAESGYPKPIAGNWTGLDPFASGIDAAVNWGNGKAYFFKGSQYIRFDIASDQTDQEVRPIAGNWPGLVTDTGSPQNTTNIKKVKIWINAFIPRDVPGVTEAAPGIHAGKTMLQGPVAGVSDCFLTDNRSFDSNPSASSRMHSEIEIDVSASVPREISQLHRCSETHEIDCEDGDSECTGRADSSRMKFFNLRGTRATEIQVNLEGAANNPCFTGSPDIDYEGIISIDIGSRQAKFDGTIDGFPAFEMYISVDGGIARTLFNTMPPPGNTPFNLPGGANRPQHASVSI
jgi:hypothetical protein